MGLSVHIEVPTPLRLPRGRFVNDYEFERFARFAASKAGEQGAVLVLADADEDCPCVLAASRLAILADLPVPASVVFAKREFESWFLASAESLSGQRGLKTSIAAPSDPDETPNPKKWLEEHHQKNSSGQKRWCYSEVTDQPALTALMDLEQARRSPSFDKLFRDVLRLMQQ